jgi:hypothetical protein
MEWNAVSRPGGHGFNASELLEKPIGYGRARAGMGSILVQTSAREGKRSHCRREFGRHIGRHIALRDLPQPFGCEQYPTPGVQIGMGPGVGYDLRQVGQDDGADYVVGNLANGNWFF